MHTQFLSDAAVPRGRYAAMHVRRGDKDTDVGQQGYTPICQYAAGLESQSSSVKDVFVSSDDLVHVLNVLKECPASKRHGWQFRGFSPAKFPTTRGYLKSDHLLLWAEITVMSRAAVVVGTLTSNTGRIVQLLRTQPEHTFVDVDAHPHHMQGSPPEGWIKPGAKVGSEGLRDVHPR